MDEGENLYIIGVRDPVKRFVSAFNWDKYEKFICHRNIGKQLPLLWAEIFNEFNSVNELVESLLARQSRRRTLAWKAITESKLHVQLGLAWYLPAEVLEILPMDRVSIVRQEYFDKDLGFFLNNIGRKYQPKELVRDKSDQAFLGELGVRDPKALSETAKFLLDHLLQDEYDILDLFFRRGLFKERYERFKRG
ncbi:hypothetical protein CCR96_21695 [Halochromatium roseum]|nr:hypothetical protein [Halochromatium roseum]